MEQENSKRQRRKPVLPFSAVIMYLSLIAILLFGVTFSRYVTGTTLGDSARVAYMKDIYISEEGNFTEQNNRIILPDVDMQKKATVHFEGSEMACYIFLEIKTVGWTRSDSDDHFYFCPVDDKQALSWAVDDDWEIILGDDSSAVYYQIVSANMPLDADVLVDGTIEVSRELTKSQLEKLMGERQELSIDIGATAVQYHGYSGELKEDYTERERAEAVWNLVKDR